MKSEECFYYAKVKNFTFWIIVYVGDVLVTGMRLRAVETVKDWLKAKFEMAEHGEIKSFLGVEFVHTQEGVSLRQKQPINTVLHQFECSIPNR